jgi:hypothetical protein
VIDIAKTIRQRRIWGIVAAAVIGVLGAAGRAFASKL